jgi:dihydrofolate reductase
MQYKMIVALCRGGGIGFQGGLPWPKLARDMRFFAKMTSSSPPLSPFANAVIMGRKTWDSLPVLAKPLKYRDNIVISSSEPPKNETSQKSCIHYIEHIDQIPESTKKYDVVWIIGGASIYEQVLLNKRISIDEIYITFIDETYEFDTSFPLGFQYDNTDELMNLRNNTLNRKIWCWNDAETIPKFLSFNNEYFFSVEDVDREFVSQITTQADISGIRERRIPDMRFLKLKRLLII